MCKLSPKALYQGHATLVGNRRLKREVPFLVLGYIGVNKAIFSGASGEVNPKRCGHLCVCGLIKIKFFRARDTSCP